MTTGWVRAGFAYNLLVRLRVLIAKPAPTNICILATPNLLSALNPPLQNSFPLPTPHSLLPIMETANPTFPPQISADLIALDKNGRVILVADIRGSRIIKRTLPRFISYLKATQTIVPFAMLVDPDTIQIIQWDGVNWSNALCCLKTLEVVKPYIRDFDEYMRNYENKWITGGYLGALLQSWLDDLAFHWKYKTPPAVEKLAEIGLLQRIEEGSTKTEVEIAGDMILFKFYELGKMNWFSR